MRCTGWLPGSCPCCLWGTHDAATTIAACERQVHMMNPRNGWQPFLFPISYYSCALLEASAQLHFHGNHLLPILFEPKS